MFLKHLESDKYFQTLFTSSPNLDQFELNEFNIDLQRGSLKLVIHTDLLPQKLKESDRESNFSAIEIHYFSIEKLSLSFDPQNPQKLYFNFDKSNKTVQALKGDKSVLSFSFEFSRLEKWSLYMRES